MRLKNPVLVIVKKRITTPQMACCFVGGPESCVGPFGYSSGGSSLFVEVWRLSPLATRRRVWWGNMHVPDPHTGLESNGPGRALLPRETASQGNGHQAETRGPRLLADAVLMAGRLVCQRRVPALGHDFLHKQPVLRKDGVCAGGTVRTGP